MKKSLVALAALAASAAFAQSTVTLSGTLDAGLEKQSSTTPLKMTSGALGTTNFTFCPVRENQPWQASIIDKQSAIKSADRSTSCLLSHATSALVKAHLFAPHERIIDRARALGYCGESRVVAGKQAFLGALALA